MPKRTGMKNSVFLIFSLILFCAFISLHALFKDSLSPIPRLEAEIERLDRERERADFKAMLLAYQLADYQQHVATLLPEAMNGKDPGIAYPLRRLASVMGVGRNGSLVIERASGLLERGKEKFRARRYDAANAEFEKLLRLYPDSVHQLEARFLLAEGQFQLKEFEAATETIEGMIDLYPESVLTGFALLRLGGIFELQERLEDAADIYRAVRENFSEPRLLEQARVALKAVDL